MAPRDHAIRWDSVTFMPQKSAVPGGTQPQRAPRLGGTRAIRVFTFEINWINLRGSSSRMGTAMISSMLAIALLWAPPDPSIAARKAYSNCLSDFVKATSEKKTPPGEFDMLVDDACSDKATSFRNLMVAADVKRGISRRTAEQGVEDELADFRASAKETYRLYVEPSATAAAQP
jgi:hypothetical protein